MANKNNRSKNNGKKAGLIAAGVTLLAYALIFPFNKIGHFLIGGALSAIAGWVVKTMATPLKGLDKNAQTKSTLDVTIIEDEYARGVVETGVEMLDSLKAERIAINESVFSRRIDETRAALDKVLRQIIEDPDKAHRIRKMNSYYLPTAIKLLQGYRSAKQQGASYMTVSATREDVLSTLDQLNAALAQVLDNMLKDDLEDMDIEIDVFEQMLKSDGLKEDHVTRELRQSAHQAAKEIPMGKSPTVKPTVPVQTKPLQQTASTVSRDAEYKPEAVTLDYQAPAMHSSNTPVPTLNVPGASASARQLAEGTPILHMPESPAAPDLSDAHQRTSKA